MAKCGIDWVGLRPGLLPGWKVWDSSEPLDARPGIPLDDLCVVLAAAKAVGELDIGNGISGGSVDSVGIGDCVGFSRVKCVGKNGQLPILADCLSVCRCNCGRRWGSGGK